MSAVRLTSTVAAGVFGLTGLYLAGYGFDRLTLGGGSGQWFVSGGVALGVAAAYAVRGYRAAIVRTPI